MSEVKFKVGDLVYCPNVTGDIVTLEYVPGYHKLKSDSFPLYEFLFAYSPNKLSKNHKLIKQVNRKGCNDLHENQIIFHATQENYELLSKLYPNVEFEPPPKRKEPREIIKAMLDSGWDCVPCFVSDDDKMTAIKKGNRVLIDMGNIYSWAFCIPFHHKTGKIIIDFVDGEVVLESENDIS